MAGTSIKVGGKYRQITAIRHKISNNWAVTKRAWEKDANNVWQRVFPNAIIVNITANTTNYNLWRAVGSITEAVDVEVTIHPGVRVMSSDTTIPAFDVGNFNSASNITIVNRGLILGKGGSGGRGALYGSSAGLAGAGGGPALRTLIPNTIIDNQGIIAGGGGGGGGGGWYDLPRGGRFSGGGGGGGAGSAENPAAGGAGGSSGHPGSAGQPGSDTPGVGGRGFNGLAELHGGTGGQRGSVGNAGHWINADRAKGPSGGGGTAGYSVIGSANVTWITSGTILGPLF